MAAYTVAQFLLDVQQARPDQTDANVLLKLNAAWGDFLQECEADTDTESISLTSGTRFYTPANRYAQVLACTYQTSATAAKSLIETTPDEIDMWYAGKRAVENASGAPTHYALESQYTSAGTLPTLLKLWLYPTPDTSTSAGYPIVKLTGTTYVAFTSSDSFPTWLFNTEFLRLEVLAMFEGDDGDLASAQGWRSMATNLRSRMVRMYQELTLREPSRVRFPFGMGDRSY